MNPAKGKDNTTRNKNPATKTRIKNYEYKPHSHAATKLACARIFENFHVAGGIYGHTHSFKGHQTHRRTACRHQPKNRPGSSVCAPGHASTRPIARNSR